MVRPPNGGDFNVLAFINAKEKEQCTFSGQPHVEMGWQGDTAHTAQGFFSIYWRNSTTASLYLCFFTLSWFLFRKAHTEVYTFNINSLFLMPGLLYTGKIPQFVLTVLFSLNIHTHSLCSRTCPTTCFLLERPWSPATWSKATTCRPAKPRPSVIIWDGHRSNM